LAALARSARWWRRALSELTADAVKNLGGPQWLVQARLDAFQRFSAAALPTQAEEIWRYSRVEDLDLDAFVLDGPESGADWSDRGFMGPLEHRGATVVVQDGRVLSIDVSPAASQAGLRVTRLSEAPERPAGLGELAASEPFVDLSEAVAPDGVLVEMSRGGVLDAPVVISHRLSGTGRMTSVRTLVRVAELAQLTVVEESASSPGSLLFLPVVELDVLDGANLSYVGLQGLSDAAWQIGHQASRIGRDASLRSLTVALGGDYARLRTDSRLVGAGGSSRLLALYFGEGSQTHDFRTLQDHVGPKTTSDLLFKGAVQDTASGVYSGLIRVAKGAHGTNAFQTNRNLVLSEGASAWSVPNLEIEENDVRCSHASAVGPVDEEQLYYLESRGVPPQTATRLIVLGFFQDLLNGAPAPELHGSLRRELSHRLTRGHQRQT
jgi:Fe-S cluster assembly protein SufD